LIAGATSAFGLGYCLSSIFASCNCLPPNIPSTIEGTRLSTEDNTCLRGPCDPAPDEPEDPDDPEELIADKIDEKSIILVLNVSFARC
jgi:hypothetical protein